MWKECKLQVNPLHSTGSHLGPKQKIPPKVVTPIFNNFSLSLTGTKYWSKRPTEHGLWICPSAWHHQFLREWCWADWACNIQCPWCRNMVLPTHHEQGSLFPKWANNTKVQETIWGEFSVPHHKGSSVFYGLIGRDAPAFCPMLLVT